MKILITGAGGYIGGMLVERFLREPQVEGVFGIDLKPCPASVAGHKRLIWVTDNLVSEGWIARARSFGPDVVIHTAFKIRQAYGENLKDQEWSNIQGSQNVFELAFQRPIKKLVYFSSVSPYGAYPSNSLEYAFKETDALRETGYIYGLHKKIVEEKLASLWKREKEILSKGKRERPLPQVLMVRPAAISGPRGQNMYKRFGLLRLISQGLPFIPAARPDIVRQFVHEDDVEDAVAFLALGDIKGEYEVFNLTPQDYLTGKEMARILGKIHITFPRFLIKAAFALLWHGTRGRIPTPPEGIRFYSFPIIADGSKITRFGFRYRYSSRDSLLAKEGRYLTGKRIDYPNDGYLKPAVIGEG